MIETRFKDTEIGKIPEEWEVKDIGEICQIVGGGTPSTDNPKFWNGQIQWFTPAELSDNIKFASKSERTISEAGLNNSSAKLLPKGTILLTTRATIGIASILLNSAATNQGFQSLIVKPNNDVEYIYYLVHTLRKEMERRASGSTFKEISPSNLSSIQCAIPPYKEQRRIAKSLSNVDALIAAVEKKIEKKKLIKQGAMQQLLTGKKRLPGFNGKWKEIRLGDVAKMNSGGTPDSKNAAYYSGTIPFLSISDMSNCGKFITHTQKHITSEAVANSSARIYPKGTLLYAMYASLGKTSIAQIDLAISQAILGIITDETILNKEYLYYNLCYIESKVIQMGQTGTQSNLSKALVEEFIFTIPEVDEQKAIANVFIGVDSEISVLEKKRDKYRHIKLGMMRELLTGRIRLVENVDKESKLYPIGMTKDPFEEAIVAEPHPD